jgi:hypothetical protein
MTQSDLVTLGMALAISFGVYHFVKNPAVKAASLGVMGVIVAKQIPYVKDAMA